MYTQAGDDEPAFQNGKALAHPLLTPEATKDLFIELERSVDTYKDLLFRSRAYSIILRALAKKRRYDINAYLSAEGKKHDPFHDYSIDSPAVIDRILRKKRLTVRFVVDTQDVIRHQLGNGIFPGDRAALLSLQKEAQPHVEKALGARNTVLLHNLRLAKNIAVRYAPTRQDADDYFQECVIGLMRAIDLFDYRRELRFSTYAVPWVKQAASRHRMNDGIIRLPVRNREAVYKTHKTKNTLGQRLGRTPTDKELAKELGIPTNKLEKQLMWAVEVSSLDAAIAGYEDISLGDIIPSPGSLELEQNLIAKEALAAKIGIVEKTLAEIASTALNGNRKVEIYRSYAFKEEATLDTVGSQYKLTRERVRQITTYIHKELLHRLGIEYDDSHKLPRGAHKASSKALPQPPEPQKTETRVISAPLVRHRRSSKRQPSIRRVLLGMQTDSLENFLENIESSGKVMDRDLAIFRAYSTGDGKYNVRQIAEVYNMSTPQVYVILRKVGDRLKDPVSS